MTLRLGGLTSVIALAAAGLAHAAPAPASGALMAGAGKVDITPPANLVSAGGAIHDPLAIRAIYIGNGASCAVLVGADQGGLSTDVVNNAISRLTGPLGCPATNFVISATHTHSGGTGGGGLGGAPTPETVTNAIVQAAQDAKARAKPARIGFGTTPVNLNVNRDLYEGDIWYQGPNRTAHSDKTLAVLGVLGEDGMPIAVYMNYAMHPINFYLTGQISADFPGAASNYIESRYPGAVAVFSQGSSGDQNPLLVDPLHKLIAVRAGNYAADGDRLDIPGPWKPRSAAALAAQPPTGAATDKTDPAAYRAAVEHSTQIVNAMGALIGQTALGVVKYLTPQMATTGSIWAEQQTISCPGRDRADAANPVRQGSLPPYNDGAPANIRVGLLRIADINLVSINGEVYSEIGSRIKAESPASKTMVVTLANGRANSGYIYSNDAGHRLTFQVIGSRLKPGCAEDRIVGATNAMFRNAAP